jgi:hypothetical protein
LKLGSEGLIYITCENSAVVAVIDRSTHKVVDAIDSGSTNAHRLIISPDGQRLYTENEEDGTVSCRPVERSAKESRMKSYICPLMDKSLLLSRSIDHHHH